jgi:ring-1,2-phenylacetyl-CoA epoxidase subunit PaaE
MTGSAHARFHRLAVTGAERVAADGSAVALTCAVPPALRETFAFRPGQHVTVRATGDDGGELRRSYSVCSTPEDLARHGHLRLGIRIVPGGTVSGRLAGVDALDALPPVGSFGTTPDPGRRRRYGAVAAGSGITPILSIVDSVLRAEPFSTFTVYYGNRTTDSAMFAEELADLKNSHARRLHLVHVFSREQRPAGLAAGRLDAATLPRLLAGLGTPAPGREWFVCGPDGLATAARRTLLGLGVPARAVHTELFGLAVPPVAPVPDAAAGRRVRVVHDSRVSTVDMGGAGSILDAALTVRPELPYSCQTGVCGTCRARVLSGSVRMSGGFALDAGEEAAGFVLTCRAQPVGDDVTVEFDAA